MLHGPDIGKGSKPAHFLKIPFPDRINERGYPWPQAEQDTLHLSVAEATQTQSGSRKTDIKRVQQDNPASLLRHLPGVTHLRQIGVDV